MIVVESGEASASTVVGSSMVEETVKSSGPTSEFKWQLDDFSTPSDLTLNWIASLGDEHAPSSPGSRVGLQEHSLESPVPSTPTSPQHSTPGNNHSSHRTLTTLPIVWLSIAHLDHPVPAIQKARQVSMSLL